MKERILELLTEALPAVDFESDFLFSELLAQSHTHGNTHCKTDQNTGDDQKIMIPFHNFAAHLLFKIGKTLEVGTATPCYF